ncbi:hypothetical protein NA57DRAFT_79028 [Rhizodiscina lignyota]|uniref:Uncharacterized protein n=1 Tax=Rhizodiscina lignyota TaxID=1504668 RepID=A0A9P4I6W6_9PEZI|nr:hypothetical protein NA57DRAFT_79028 [Rhizodiscina lignyota]
MTDSVSRLFSKLSSKEDHSAHASYVLTLRPSPNIPDLTLIQPPGYPPEAPPLCSVISSKKKKNVEIFRGTPDPSRVFGDARFHSFSSSIQMTLRGQPIKMKMSSMSSSFNFECHPMGKLKWAASQMSGSESLALHDHSGNKLARLKSAKSSGTGEKQLEILVPCDDFFIDLVLLSGMVAMTLTKTNEDSVMEVVQQLAGGGC